MTTKNITKDSLYQSIVNIIANTKDYSSVIPYLNQDVIDYLIRNYKKYDISSKAITELLKYCDSNELKKELLDNQNEFEFAIVDIIEIVSSMDDDGIKNDIVEKNIYHYNEYIIDSIIANNPSFEYKKKKLLDYNGDMKHESGIVEIIRKMSSKEKKQIIDNFEDYNLSNKTIFKTLFDLDYYYTHEKIKDLYTKLFLSKRTPKKIKLNPLLTFGIEIEFMGENARLINGNYFGKNWNAHPDASLEGAGYELSSPIMRSTLGYEDEIYRTCFALKERGWTITNLCAGHIHFGVEYFEGDIDSLRTFVDIYRNVERILFIISNKENELPREGIVIHTAILKDKLAKKEKEGIVDLSKPTNLLEFRDEIKKVQEVRWYGINFLNVGLFNKNTIEFRMPNGSLDGDVWVDNINLFGGILQAAKKISNLKNKDFNNITLEDLNVLKTYTYLTKGGLSEEERVNLLLDLSVDKEDKDIYLRRYYANNVLEEDSEIENFLDDTGKPKRPIRLREY